VVHFVFVIIRLFHYLLQLRHYKRKSVEVSVFKGGGSLLVNILGGRGQPPLEWQN